VGVRWGVLEDRGRGRLRYEGQADLAEMLHDQRVRVGCSGRFGSGGAEYVASTPT
jgi:hypothetical protein